MQTHVHNGSIEAVVLWNTKDLGYLSVWARAALARGALRPGEATLSAGRLGVLKIDGDQIVLGAPVIFRKDNIDQFNF